MRATTRIAIEKFARMRKFVLHKFEEFVQ